MAIRLLQEYFPWISFIWCFSHQLELALKDALKEFIKQIINAFVLLYKKSSKKHRELKTLYHLLEGQF